MSGNIISNQDVGGFESLGEAVLWKGNSSSGRLGVGEVDHRL